MTDSSRTLRRHALALLRSRSGEATAPPLSSQDLSRIVHDLRVHQIELELQNEELERGQRALETSRQELLASEQRYRELYEQAPVAYMSLDREGVVVDANPATARLLGAARERLPGRKLADFVAPQDQDAYYLARRAAFEGRTPSPRQLSVIDAKASQHVVELVIASVRAGDAAEKEVR